MSRPGRVGPSPPRTSPAAPQNRLRVTSPAPHPARAGLRPDPSVVSPSLSDPGSLPCRGLLTYGPTGSSGGGRLRPSSEHTAQQHRGAPATRRIYVTPSPGTSGRVLAPAHPKRHGALKPRGALPATRAAEGRASSVT